MEKQETLSSSYQDGFGA